MKGSIFVEHQIIPDTIINYKQCCKQKLNQFTWCSSLVNFLLEVLWSDFNRTKSLEAYYRDKACSFSNKLTLGCFFLFCPGTLHYDTCHAAPAPAPDIEVPHNISVFDRNPHIQTSIIIITLTSLYWSSCFWIYLCWFAFI